MQHPSVEGFWKFCSLRQEAYWLRQRGEKHPDPAFRFHFCNVYREADRGTVWFRKEVEPRLHGDRLEKLSDLLWFATAYRLLNRLDTFKDFGGLPPREDKGHWLRFLKERMAGGHKIFTGRHLNIGFAKYEAALDYSDVHNLGLSQRVGSAIYLQQVVKTLETVPGIGTFFGWQIACDLLESGRLQVSDADSWVHLGPGAWNALKLIFPDAARKDSVQLSRELWATQSRYVHPDPATVDSQWELFPLVPPPQAPGPMSLKNVEHALCEYARYVRVITTPEGKGVGLEVKKW
jgi:hypothetical protein